MMPALDNDDTRSVSAVLWKYLQSTEEQTVIKCLQTGESKEEQMHTPRNSSTFERSSTAKLSSPPNENTPLVGNKTDGFSTVSASFFVCVGATLGCGNLWRFPRVLADNGAEGGLAFILLYVFFMFVWAVPLTLAQFAIGMFRSGNGQDQLVGGSQRGLVESFAFLRGEQTKKFGMWMNLINLFVVGTFVVVLGYSIFYMYYFANHDLPYLKEGLGCNSTDPVAENTTRIWVDFQNSEEPVIYHVCAVLLLAALNLLGVRGLERVSLIVVPLVLLTLFVGMGYAVSLKGAVDGLRHMFRMDTGAFLHVDTWIDALVQSGFDSGAAFGHLIICAASMRRETPVVKLAVGVPVAHIIASLSSAAFVFAIAFSQLKSLGCQTSDIVGDIGVFTPMHGFAITWMPLFFSRIKQGGTLCVIFFATLVIAGLLSLNAFFEMIVRALMDLNFRRPVAVFIIALLVFLVGLPSVLHHDLFVIQDFVWTLGLIVSAVCIVYLVYIVPINTLRDTINKTTSERGDWMVSKAWACVESVLIPLMLTFIFAWWVVDSFRRHHHAYDPTVRGSLMSAALAFLGAAAIVAILCFFLKPVKGLSENSKLSRLLFSPAAFSPAAFASDAQRKIVDPGDADSHDMSGQEDFTNRMRAAFKI